jgi:type I restriction enzyme M protein
VSERDEEAKICRASNGEPEPDPELRDTESVPLKEDVHAYFEREVRPHVPDAWIDETKTKVGYEIPFTRHFYIYKALRSLADIEADIRSLEREIQGMLGEVLL